MLWLYNMYNWIWAFLTNKLAQYLIEMHHNYYIIHYPLGVKWYKAVIPRNRGPSPFIDSITDENGNDIKEEVYKFLGPCFDFHMGEITPKIMGYSKITIKTLSKSYIFNENEIIKDLRLYE